MVAEACRGGCRKREACAALGITTRTLQRWERQGLTDQRKGRRAKPANALSEAERAHAIALMNAPAYRDLSPNQLVPTLADEGTYVASESTLYRILRAEKMNAHRQGSRPPTQSRPQPKRATGPNQLWSWDITYLPTQVAGIFLYLYLIVDVYSRKIVAWQVHDRECAGYAAELATEACFLERVTPEQVRLHSDNGSPMKGFTMLLTLQKLGVMPSFSRPSVSNDNPFSEALFRTLKYCPAYPQRPFADLEQAREWVETFVRGYNHQHLHSAIRYLTPNERHRGQDGQILAQRHQVYQQARVRHPERWSGRTRNWSPVTEVVLNPAREPASDPKRWQGAA